MITNASHVGSNFRSHRSVWFCAGPGSARQLWVTCCRLDAFLLSWLILTFCLSLKCWTGKGKHECRIKLVMVWKLRTVMRYCLCLQSIGCHSRGEVARDVHGFKEHPSQTSRRDAETGKNVTMSSKTQEEFACEQRLAITVVGRSLDHPGSSSRAAIKAKTLSVNLVHRFERNYKYTLSYLWESVPTTLSPVSTVPNAVKTEFHSQTKRKQPTQGLIQGEAEVARVTIFLLLS